MTYRVWVDAWQMQCCGDPFSVGSTVDWTVLAEIDREWISSFMGDEEAARFTHDEEHHGDLLPSTPHVIGVVTRIDAVFCRYGAVEGERALQPIAGSSRFEPRESVDGWEDHPADDHFAGYAVDIDELDV